MHQMDIIRVVCIIVVLTLNRFFYPKYIISTPSLSWLLTLSTHIYTSIYIMAHILYSKCIYIMVIRWESETEKVHEGKNRALTGLHSLGKNIQYHALHVCLLCGCTRRWQEQQPAPKIHHALITDGLYYIQSAI